MNNQQLFDIVSKHLLKQGRRSVNAYGSCRYYGDDGLKCAIGCLIPENKYNKEFEGKIITEKIPMDEVDLMNTNGHKPICDAAGIGEDQVKLALALQRIHDEGSPQNWGASLESVAKKFKLTFKDGK